MLVYFPRFGIAGMNVEEQTDVKLDDLSLVGSSSPSIDTPCCPQSPPSSEQQGSCHTPALQYSTDTNYKAGELPAQLRIKVGNLYR